MVFDHDTDPNEPITETDLPPEEAETQSRVAEPIEQVDLRLGADRLTVKPGERVTLPATISNISQRTRHYRLEVEGIRASWLLDFPLPIRLFRQGLEDSTGQRILTISPPREPASEAKDYDVWVSAVSEDEQVRSERQHLLLTVEPYLEFNTELWPEVYRAGQEAELVVRNQSNQTRNFTVRGYDPGDEVRFVPSERLVEVERGKATVAGFRVAPRKLNLFGRPQDYRFTLETTPLSTEDQSSEDQEGEVQEAEVQGEKRYGVVRSQRRLPPWALLFLLALLCIPLTAFVFLLSQEQPDTAVVTVATPALAMMAQAPPPAPTLIPELEIAPSKRLIEEGETVLLQISARNLASIRVSGNDQGNDDIYQPAPNGGLVITAQALRRPKVTTTYVVTGYRTLEDFRSNVSAIIQPINIQVQQLISAAITFSKLPNGQMICPGCKLNGDEYLSQGIFFSVAGDKLPGECTSRAPVVGIFAAGWNDLFLTTAFTKQKEVPKVICITVVPPYPSQGGTPATNELPSCLLPTATPTRSPLQQCTFAPLKISFIKPTREVTFTFAYNPPITTSVEFPGLPAGTTFVDPGQGTNTRTLKVLPGQRIKDVIFGLDGQPVGLTKIEYRYVQK